MSEPIESSVELLQKPHPLLLSDEDILNANTDVETDPELIDEEDENQNHDFVEKASASYFAKEKRAQIINSIFLSTFIIAVLFGFICITLWLIDSSNFGTAPTLSGQESRKSALESYIGLIFLGTIGFLILLFKVKYLFIAFLYMLGVTFVLIWSINGAVRANNSKNEDSLLGDMPFYFKTYYEKTGSIPQFYHHLQESCECCGFNDIDRIKDWPEQLQSPDFPSSCCKDSSKLSPEVACSGLGRMFNFTRVPSGFLIIQTEQQIETWSKMRNKDVIKPKINVTSYIKQFEAEVQLEMNLKSNKAKTILKSDSNMISTEIQIKFDTFVEELVYSDEIPRGEWVYFKLPSEKIKPSRAKRPASTQKPSNNTNNNDSQPLFAYYVSKGLVENILLDGIIWHNRCERDVKRDHKVQIGVTCGSLKTDKPEYDHYHDAKNSSDYPKWNREMHSSNSSKFFFENAMAYMLSWDYFLLPIVSIFTFTLGIIFCYVRFKSLTPIPPPPQQMDLLGPILFPGVKNFDKIPIKVQEQLFRRKLQKINKTMTKEFYKKSVTPA